MDKMYREQSESQVLVLSDEARDSWISYSQFIENQQGEGQVFETIQDWTGKLPGAALRISGLLHIVEHGIEVQAINRQTIDKVLDFCELLIEHARAFSNQLQAMR